MLPYKHLSHQNDSNCSQFFLPRSNMYIVWGVANSLVHMHCHLDCWSEHSPPRTAYLAHRVFLEGAARALPDSRTPDRYHMSSISKGFLTVLRSPQRNVFLLRYLLTKSMGSLPPSELASFPHNSCVSLCLVCQSTTLRKQTGSK